MPTFWDDLLIIFIFSLPFLLLQLLLSTRKKIFLGFIVPILWTALGIWTIINNYKDGNSYIKELIFFFLIGDIILIGILALMKRLKVKKDLKL